MSWPILIPSRGRVKLLGTQGSTIHQFDEELIRRTHYFVEPIEYAQYSVPANKIGFNLVPVSTKGMGDLRHQMALWAEENEHQAFFMFDDDLQWFTRKSWQETGLKKADVVDIKNMLTVAEQTLYCLDSVACVGISARQGNNTKGTGDVQLLEPNTRIIRAFMFKTAPFLQMIHGRVPFMEDFDVLLQLLENGWENRNLYFWAQDQRSTQAEGGCSLTRTHANHEASAVHLKELHPDVVSLRQKENKTGGEFGKRTEVTIQWKRALRKL